MNCPRCNSTKVRKNGTSNKNGFFHQKLACGDCGLNFNEGTKKKYAPLSPEPEELVSPGVPETVPEVLPGVPETLKRVGLSESELRAKYDNTFILQTVVATLTRDNFIQERDFIQLCKFRGNNYRTSMEEKQFDDYHGVAGGITYWGHKDDISRLKIEGILR